MTCCHVPIKGFFPLENLVPFRGLGGDRGDQRTPVGARAHDRRGTESLSGVQLGHLVWCGRMVSRLFTHDPDCAYAASGRWHHPIIATSIGLWWASTTIRGIHV
jgi:hypothetical protein